MKSRTPEYWIDKLNLERHTEGGYFREVYRKKADVQGGDLATSIYYLLPSGEASKLHRLENDEVWYYHYGSPLILYFITPQGKAESYLLGPEVEQGHHFSKVIPARTIFGAEVRDPDTFSLVSCNMSPGFDYDDFELMDRKKMLTLYPEYADMIHKLT